MQQLFKRFVNALILSRERSRLLIFSIRTRLHPKELAAVRAEEFEGKDAAGGALLDVDPEGVAGEEDVGVKGDKVRGGLESLARLPRKVEEGLTGLLCHGDLAGAGLACDGFGVWVVERVAGVKAQDGFA